MGDRSRASNRGRASRRGQPDCRALVGLRRRGLRAVLSLLLAVGVAASLHVAPIEAAPVYSYFPSASVTDGRMLSVVGDGLSSLGGNSVTLSFSVANTSSSFLIGFFDGDDRSVWDANQTTNFPTTFELYEDPLGNGTGTVLAATWTDTQMTQNSWRDFSVNTSPSAKSPSGNYFYRLTIRGTTANSTYNNFKVRVEGATYITPTSVFGLMAAKATGISNDSTYDGTWDFIMVVPNGATYVGVWDGDFDYGPSAAIGDTDDPNTSNTGIPAWSPPSAAPEGAKGIGAPPDDHSDVNLRRSPSVGYQIIGPSGATYTNANPSGNTEWEYFRIDTAPFNATQMDHHADSLPAGAYRIRLTGMDWKNLCAMKFDYPIVGQDENGDPLIPPAPFLVGDLVWNDTTPDGVKAPGEPGIGGVLVNLVDAVSGSVVGTATTDAAGAYTMTAWNGTYHVAPDASNFLPGGVLNGWQPSSAATRTITVTNANVMSADFGMRPIPRVSVTPNRVGSAVPGDTIPYSFTVQNNDIVSGTLDLTTVSTLGFVNQILDAGGVPVTSVTLGPGASTVVTVRIAVPLGATVGSRDVTRLTATLRGQPSVNASAIAETTIGQAVDISPDNADSAGAGTDVYYSHTVTNGSSATQNVTLSTSDSRGWTVAVFAADGVTPISSLTLGPNGGSANIVVRVSVPSGASDGTASTTTVTATMGLLSDSATDVTTVGSLLTYPTAAYLSPQTEFTLGATVFARATDLRANRGHHFVWKDQSGTVRYTSVSANSDSNGVATDSYVIASTDPVGTWTVEVYRTSSGALISSTAFDVSYDAAISELYATDAATIGAVTMVTSTEDNSSIATIANSYVDYRIWWDSNSNNVFDNGDIFMLSDGTPSTYSGSGAAISHTTSGITLPPFTSFTDPGWQMSNASFPNQGTYNLTATWKTSGGSVIDVRTTQFFSVPTVGEWFAGLGVPSLPVIALFGFVWAGAVFHLRSRRAWLSFYVLGSLGCVVLVLFVAQALGLDTRLEAIEAVQVAWLADVFNIRVSLLPPSGLAIGNHVGWGVFDIGIECSALLEMAAFAALVGFYPPWRAGRKAMLIAAGVAATYVVNLLRILIIVGMISRLGTDWVFIAHAVVGRVFFFAGVITIFWFLVTMPTVRTLSARLEGSHG